MKKKSKKYMEKKEHMKKSWEMLSKATDKFIEGIALERKR